MSTALTESAIQDALAKLPDWAFADDTIHKTYRFASFSEAIGFIAEMAFSCEKANHHPDLSNVYSTVTIRLSTHDVGNKVTQKDVDLALEIEKLAEKRA
ncbi:MAG: 4a-hydroxytetrahydrobiopterin dehydratase [Verrucomicrobiota bacterium]|jgi:4a-hydroxytetrahydrobiopterin dehydratase|nr:4a-hydroxytetrahydrobiopterin dehydratase [Verrucomicrobiales bacterium]MDP6678435.1 4a-hydroxytetrahydrobiopterin dehydratase [Verrucomicrobiota bacterium]MDP6752815.1 4a-hydroxytetrahydrobiopterin dehydratase [Verrucomicrobiota bacterium]|tara:strand:+ start:39 stop:335 length:297 start_codon:yes stop_codon:yes gene_type:complete